MNLQLNDPSVPGPGEMITEGSAGYATLSPQLTATSPLLIGGDPHHNRAPSLGELHQELEAEQEAQVVCYTCIVRYEFRLANMGHGRIDFCR